MTSLPVAIGPLTVQFSEDPFCQSIQDWMYGELPVSQSDVDIEIKGNDLRETRVPDVGATRASESISLDGERVYVHKIRSYSRPERWVVDRLGHRGYALRIDGWDTDVLSIDVYYHGALYEDGLSPIRTLFKLNDWTFADYQDRLAKHFVYDVFEPLWQGWMLRQGYTFLHAASISVGGRGVVLTGWGGTGKTSATSSLIRRSDDIEFLSDDLSIVSDEGDLYPYYKSSVIYAYNTEGDEMPASALLKGSLDRAHWHWRAWRYGKKGVRRRIPPEALFEGSVGSPEPRKLSTAIYLSREVRDGFDHERISYEDMARRSTSVILDELDWLMEYTTALCAAGSTVEPREIIKRTERNYRKCFHGSETVLLRIPRDTGPTELADYVETELLDR